MFLILYISFKIIQLFFIQFVIDTSNMQLNFELKMNEVTIGLYLNPLNNVSKILDNLYANAVTINQLLFIQCRN